MANRFWFGGTGTWDASDTSHWGTASNGVGAGASVPGASDDVTFDANSGGGTVTVNTNITTRTITMGAFTGSLDFSANNNTVTLSGAGGLGGLSLTGTGARTLVFGNASNIWTLSGVGNPVFDATVTTNLVLTTGTAIINVTGTTTTVARSIVIGTGITLPTLNISDGGVSGMTTQITGAGAVNNLTITGPIAVTFGSGTSITVNTSLNFTGSKFNGAVMLQSSSGTAVASVAAPASPSNNWCAVKLMTFTGAAVSFVNSLNCGGNTLNGGTITGPPRFIVGG